ncbi:MAG: sigma 54-interacting transcriptional regulator, partial [Candidatus Binatia bacterium]
MGSPLLLEDAGATLAPPTLRLLRDAAPAVDEPSLLGTSHALQRVRELVSRAALTDATVLVTGESGTG